MIEIKTTLKKYGDETRLWYFGHQGEQFPVVFDTKEGYLVQRQDVETTKLFLVKHKHAVLMDFEEELEN